MKQSQPASKHPTLPDGRVLRPITPVYTLDGDYAYGADALEVMDLVALGHARALGSSSVVHRVQLLVSLIWFITESEYHFGPRLLGLRNYCGQSYTHREQVGESYVIQHNPLPLAGVKGMAKVKKDGIERSYFQAVLQSVCQPAHPVAEVPSVREDKVLCGLPGPSRGAAD